MEFFKDIPNYENHYQISNLGNVKSFKKNKEKLLVPVKCRKGYLNIKLSIDGKPKTYKIHRLVLLAFKPDENFKVAQINHINGIKTDNRVENLEWCDQFHNMQHAIKTGLRTGNIGSINGRAKLCEKQIPVIRELYKLFKNYSLIGRLFKVSHQTIERVVKNTAWV